MKTITLKDLEPGPRLEDTLETEGTDLVSEDELLLYLSRITTRVESLQNQAITLGAVIDVLIEDGDEYTDPHIAGFIAELEQLDVGIATLLAASEELINRVLEEL